MQNVLIASVTTLIIGLLLGYVVFAKTPAMSGMQHTMPDGTVMNGSMSGMDSMMMDMMAELDGKSGDEFDKAFLSEMVVHHEGAVEMAQASLTSAKHQEIKDLAKAIISAQNTEIAQMRAWHKSWYGVDLR